MRKQFQGPSWAYFVKLAFFSEKKAFDYSCRYVVGVEHQQREEILYSFQFLDLF